MLTDVLTQYGFTLKESKVYIAVLELGSAPASSIARRIGENRATIYSVLKELEKKGYISQLVRKDLTYFSAVSPNILFEKLQKSYHLFQDALPSLLALTEQAGNKPKIQIFEGLEAVKTFIEDQLSSSEPIKSFYGDYEMNAELKERIYTVHIPKRAKLNIAAQVILANNEHGRNYHTTPDHIYMKQSILLNDPLYQNPVAVNFYDNKISLGLYTSDEMTGIIIESPKLYQFLTNLFGLIWRANGGSTP